MARTMDLVTELESDNGARLTSLEARKSEDDLVSVVFAGSSTFSGYVESQAVLGR